MSDEKEVIAPPQDHTPGSVFHVPYCPRGLAWFLSVAFLALIYVPAAIALWESGFEARSDSAELSPSGGGEGKPVSSPVLEADAESNSRPFFPKVREWNKAALAAMKSFEDRLLENSILPRNLASATQDVLANQLGAGTEQVYPGRDHWLFFRPDIEYAGGVNFMRAQAKKTNPVEAIVEFHRELAERGIQLIVLPAPTKATIYPEKFSRRYKPEDALLQNPGFADFCTQLEEAGVKIFDTAPLLAEAKTKSEKPLFLPGDTHWSPEGVQIVADALAKELEPLLPPAKDQAKFIKLYATDNIRGTGDLTRMLKLQGESAARHDPPVSVMEIHPNDRMTRINPTDILFLGDSYANIFSLEAMGWGKRAGLIEQLEFRLSRSIERITINDNGAYATRRELWRRTAAGQNPLGATRVVIYEFAARELLFGDWRMGFDYTTKNVAAAESSVGGPGGAARIVTATVGEVTRPPRPGSVPYKDCLVSIHLKNAQSEDKSVPSELVVFTWGMRDNRLLDLGAIRPGARVSFRLTPWSEAEAEFGSFNRVEFDDDRLLLQIYWRVEENDEERSQSRTENAGRDIAQAETQPQPETNAAPAILDLFKREFETAQQNQRNVIKGRDGWLYFAPELRALTVGEFWGEAAKTASRATNPEWADPLAAIEDFHRQLAALGVELIIVPAPMKAAVYVDRFNFTEAISSNPQARIDAEHRRFYKLLEARGVKIVDPTENFLEQRAAGEPQLYCATDTHWTSQAAELVARLIADEIGERDWLSAMPKRNYAKVTAEIEIEGDLARMLHETQPAKEKLPIAQVKGEGGAQADVISRESPILLLGDSYVLAFHAGGDMLAEGAGLPDHLAGALGAPVDLIAVRGSGTTAPRIDLLRRGDKLAGKKLVIWCFAARDLTESAQGWRPAPVARSLD
jgi:hypothetical protein